MPKYLNKKTTVLGIEFSSKREAMHALWLESERKKSKAKIIGWEYQPIFNLYAAIDTNRRVSQIKKIGTHRPDFLVNIAKKDGYSQEVHEIKADAKKPRNPQKKKRYGTKTEAWRLRKKIFEANYPHIPYRVFDGNKISNYDIIANFMGSKK